MFGGYWHNAAPIAHLAQHGLLGDCKIRITGTIQSVVSVRHIILLVPVLLVQAFPVLGCWCISDDCHEISLDRLLMRLFAQRMRQDSAP